MLIGLLLIPSAVALADQSYHTERLSLTLTPAGEAAGHTLRNGMVVNIHPNGPVNGAIENYVLNGAKPNTEYQVYWNITGMGKVPTNVGSSPSPIVVQTDSRGNGHFTYKISRAYQEEMGFVGFDGTLRWEFEAGGVTVFQTDWTHVVVD